MRRSLAAFSLLLALVSLAASFVFYRVAKDLYRREAMVRLAPFGTPSYTETGLRHLPPVLFLGDSRIVQWTGFSSGRVHAFNAGIDGETTAQILGRTGAAIEKVKPAVIVIQAGINDLKAIPLMPSGRNKLRTTVSTICWRSSDKAGRAARRCSSAASGRLERSSGRAARCGQAPSRSRCKPSIAS